jgi:putative flippase GtrA
VGLTVLGTLVSAFGVSAGWANVCATACGTVPSFELNRRWVWGRRGRRSPWAEMGPFAVWSVAGLARSTLAVHVAAGWAAGQGWSPAGRTVVALAANVGAYGLLWVAQFVWLDRVLFRGRDQAAAPAGRVPATTPARFVEVRPSRRRNTTEAA